MATEQRLEYFKSLARDGLIDSNGGIRAAEAVPKLYERMLTASKLVTKAIMLNVIKYTDQTDKMTALCRSGGWRLLNRWLAEARRDENRALEKLLLEVFHRLPVTVEMLKSNDSAKMVKHIAKGKNNGELADLASSLVDKWMEQIKAEMPLPPPQQQQPQTASAGDGSGPPEHKRKRLDSGSDEQQQRRSAEKSSSSEKKQRKTPSTARTAPSHFRDTNLLASDEPPLAPTASSSAAAAAAKAKSDAASDSSAPLAKRKRPDTDLESIHASISVKPNQDSAKSGSNHSQQQQQQGLQKKRPIGELHLDSGFMDSLFSNGGQPSVGGSASGGAGGNGQQAQQHGAKLVRKRKKSDGSAAPNSGSGATPTTPESPSGPSQSPFSAQPSSASQAASAPSPTEAENDVPVATSGLASSVGKKSGRRVSWAPDEHLEQVSYFELDETERVNVNRQSVEELSRQEHERERELVSKARKESLRDGCNGGATSGGDVDSALQLQRGRPPQWYRPRLISGLPAYAAESASGRKSTERGRQAKKQEAILQVIYFSRDAVPPSPAEPEVEHAEPEEPRLIPLEDVSKTSLPPPPPPQPQAPPPQQQTAVVQPKQVPPPQSQKTQQPAEPQLPEQPPISVSTVLPNPDSVVEPAPSSASANSSSTIPSVSSTISANSTASSSSISTSSVTPASVSDLLITIGKSSDGGLALKDEVADILKQVTRNLTTASATVASQPAPAIEAAAQPSIKEALWRLLRSRYPDLHLQRSEDLTVDRIRSLLEPLKEELAASGMFPQVLASLLPQQPNLAVPPPPQPSLPPPSVFMHPPPQSVGGPGGVYPPYRPPQHARFSHPPPMPGHLHRPPGPPRHRLHRPPGQQQQQEQAPRGVCRSWFATGECRRSDCRFRHQL